MLENGPKYISSKVKQARGVHDIILKKTSNVLFFFNFLSLTQINLCQFSSYNYNMDICQGNRPVGRYNMIKTRSLRKK